MKRKPPEPKPLHLFQNNEPTIPGTIRKTVDGQKTPYDLTGGEVQFFIKLDADEDDSEASQYSSTTPTEIDIVDATLGKIEIKVKATDLDESGDFWYHLDVIPTLGGRQTVAFGPLRVINV